MPNDQSSPHPIDIHRVQSILLNFGGSLLGAQQFLAGQIVTNPADRQALAQMVVDLSNHSRGGGMVRADKNLHGGGATHRPGEDWKSKRNGGWGSASGKSDGGSAGGYSGGQGSVGGSSGGSGWSGPGGKMKW